ncbi:MAG TPA: hypothetical protein VIL74_23295 [Pyrinomonadaceae bacterium]|jgi:hypothetical protein
MSLRFFIVLLIALFTFSCTTSENHSHAPQAQNSERPPVVTETMPEHSHDTADPHMKMTELRARNDEDLRGAEEVAAKARRAIEKYKDYKVALRDRFEILLPEVPQTMYHFNKLENYLEAESRFNPERPTSLLYEKNGDGYRLIGVMYTAPAGLSEDELNERVPLSVTQWHQHINICLPRGSDTFRGLIGQGDRFGLTGSIATREECETAGGQFLPRLLGWMVHLYPYESATEQMWSVERQMNSDAVNP